VSFFVKTGRWKDQPPSQAKVDLSHPLLRGAYLFHNFRDSTAPKDSTINGFGLTATNSPVVKEAIYGGQGLFLTQSSSQYSVFTSAPSIGNEQAFTFFCYASLDYAQAGATSKGRLFNLRSTSSGTPILSMGIGSNGVAGNAWCPTAILRDDVAFLNSYSSDTTAITDKQPRLWAIVRKAGTGAGVSFYYINGNRIPTIGSLGTSSDNPITFNAAGSAYGVDPVNTSLSYWPGWIFYGGLLLDHTWTFEQFRDLNDNAWQIFERDNRHRTFHLSTGTADITATPGAATLTITGYAPTVTVTGDISVNPGVSALALTGYAPTVSITEHQTVTPDPGALALTGFAPTVTVAENQTVSPANADLALTGYAPSVSVTTNHIVLPGAGALDITAIAPTVTVTTNHLVNPTTGALVLTGYAPTITVESQSKSFTPGAAALEITGYAPSVSVSGVVRGTGAGGYARYLKSYYPDVCEELKKVEKEKKKTEKEVQKLEKKIEVQKEKALDYKGTMDQLISLYAKIEKLEDQLNKLMEELMDLEQEEILLLAECDLL